jgi:hypothetical protein
MKTSTCMVEEDLKKKEKEIGMWSPEFGRNERGLY